MTRELSDVNGLHLPDLKINGFRGFDSLSIGRLGRVNLITGENSVGKTTVLEAVRLYAARGRYRVLEEILDAREELTHATDSDGDRVSVIDWDSLFHTSLTGSSGAISIGPLSGKNAVKISFTQPNPEFMGQLELFARIRSRERPGFSMEFQDLRLLAINVGEQGYRMPISPDINYRYFDRYSDNDARLPREISTVTLGPNLPRNEDIERFWDKLVEETEEYRGVNALGLILKQKINDVLLVAGTDHGGRFSGRRAVVGFSGRSHRVPLKSLGDGAVRVFSIGVAIAYCKGGILIVDEAENGIHHGKQINVWRMIFETAIENDVQIFATTHSWDCVYAFALAAREYDDDTALMIRLDREEESLKIFPKSYFGLNLQTAAEQEIEVR